MRLIDNCIEKPNQCEISLADKAFEAVGLDWTRHVRTDPRFMRFDQPTRLLVGQLRRDQRRDHERSRKDLAKDIDAAPAHGCESRRIVAPLGKDRIDPRLRILEVLRAAD
jgi:hypothetical protein